MKTPVQNSWSVMHDVDVTGDPLGHRLMAEYDALLRYANRLTRNRDASDLVQSVMVRALSREEQLPRTDSVRAWLRTVLFRLFIDERRRSKREMPLGGCALEQPAEPAEPAPSWAEVTVDDVRRSVALLPDQFREPYELFTFKRLSYSAIAERSGVPQRTVGTRISRARQRLRVLLMKKVARSNGVDGAR